MSGEANKAVMWRFWEELFNHQRFEVAEDIVVADYTNHDLIPGETPGREGLTQFIRLTHTMAPDIHYTVEDMLTEGDKVVTRWTAMGTQQGEFVGIPPSNRQFTISGIAIHRLAGEKVAEAWNNWDALGFMQQLGVIPQLQQTGTRP